MPQPPEFHQPSATVRFWVEIDQAWVGASVGKAALHYRFGANTTNDDPLATYQAHAAEIDAAVRRRIAAGSRDPVMLQDGDLRAVPQA